MSSLVTEIVYMFIRYDNNIGKNSCQVKDAAPKWSGIFSFSYFSVELLLRTNVL